MNVAVVIPVGQGHERLVREAIRSTWAGLRWPQEVVVVPDGVPVEFNDPFPLQVFLRIVTPAAPAGRSHARNCGVGAAMESTEWIYFLDADDILMPTALGDFETVLAEHPDADLVYADYQSSRGRSYDLVRPERQWQFGPFDRAALRRRMIGNIGCFVRRDRFLEIGGFDETKHFGEDYDFWLRYALNERVNVVKHTRPFFHARKGLHTVHRAGRFWNEAVAAIGQTALQGGYESWATR